MIIISSKPYFVIIKIETNQTLVSHKYLLIIESLHYHFILKKNKIKNSIFHFIIIFYSTNYINLVGVIAKGYILVSLISFVLKV